MPGRFSVGQLVEVDATGFDGRALLQTGDRGTVVREAYPGIHGNMEVNILWHKNLTESTVPEDDLRVYVNPMDAPGRAKGSFDTKGTLRIVLREEMPHAMEEIRRDLERARMTAEDYAQGNARLTEPGCPPISWRQSCGDYRDCVDRLQDQIDSVIMTVDEARDGQTTERDALQEICYHLDLGDFEEEGEDDEEPDEECVAR